MYIEARPKRKTYQIHYKWNWLQINENRLKKIPANRVGRRTTAKEEYAKKKLKSWKTFNQKFFSFFFVSSMKRTIFEWKQSFRSEILWQNKKKNWVEWERSATRRRVSRRSRLVWLVHAHEGCHIVKIITLPGFLVTSTLIEGSKGCLPPSASHHPSTFVPFRALIIMVGWDSYAPSGTLYLLLLLPRPPFPRPRNHSNMPVHHINMCTISVWPVSVGIITLVCKTTHTMAQLYHTTIMWQFSFL